MEFIIQVILLLIIIVAANYIQKQNDVTTRRLFDRLLLIASLPLLFLGVLAVFMTDSFLQTTGWTPGTPEFPFTNTLALGIVLQVTAVWGIACSFPAVRQSLSRLIPVNPDSVVHTLALVMAGWLMGGTLLQLTQISLEMMAETLGSITIGDFVVQQLAFVAVGVLGVGLSIRRSFPQTMARLGLGPVTLRQLLEGTGWIAFLLLIQAVAGLLWEAINPEQVALVEAVNTQLQDNLDTIWEWVILALAAGIGEEILFRGAIQPVLGKWFTSIMFAIAHIQYGLFTPATLALFIISMALGVVRERHNTTVAIFVHVGYDLVLGIAAYFALA